MTALILALAAEQLAANMAAGPPRDRPPMFSVLNRPAKRTPADALAHGVVRLLPSEAIVKAADAAPSGVTGVFDFVVRQANYDRGYFYLNSETDYRDQRNLTIAISPRSIAEFKKRYGDDLAMALKGRRILVVGQARRVRIDFTNDGKPSGKYYYQTHVFIANPDQLTVVNS